VFACCALVGGAARAQQHIGSTAEAHNKVQRELSGASAPLTAGDPVFRDERVSTGDDSTAKLIFLDSTNLAIGPISRVTLDRFVYSGGQTGQELGVGLAKGVFRFTTGAFDKKAYTISTPTASIGVRGTVLDIDVRTAQSRVTLVEGQALFCPRRPGITFQQQRRNCEGGGSGRCDCLELKNPGQTASAKKSAGSIQVGFTSTPVDFASLCASDASLCSSSTYASAGPLGGGGGGGGGFPSGALCGH
jgi:hypothetical protein